MKRQRQAKALIRDRQIYRKIGKLRQLSIRSHGWRNKPISDLSVYLGDLEDPKGNKLTRFPITNLDGQRMPRWEELTLWLKTQVLVMALHEWGMLTFSIHVHPQLEKQWVASGADPLKMLRDRIRVEIRKKFGDKKEYFFVLEGWSKLTKAPTKLHIHGGFFVGENDDHQLVLETIGRACGHGIKGYSQQSRALHKEMYHRDGSRYVDYLFKSVRRKDDRITGRRLSFSREATGAAREMWGLMTDPR